MGTGWKLLKKVPVRYSPENPPTVSECLRLSTPREQRGRYEVLVDRASRRAGTLLVAVAQATLPIPDEYKDSSAKLHAILEFDKSQVRVDVWHENTEQPRWRRFPSGITQFLVTRRGALTVYLYLLTGTKDRDHLLGSTRMHLDFDTDDEERKFTFQSLQLDDGGSIRVGAEYCWTRTETREQQVFLTSDETTSRARIPVMREKDTQRLYAVKIIPKAEAQNPASYARAVSMVENPFVAPLSLSLEAAKNTYLLSPFISGGQLFYYLQMERCFELERSRLYAAEILSALEYLHGLETTDTHRGKLHPSQIRLDAIGHIVICDFEIHTGEEERPSNPKDEEDLDRLAPELLLGQERTKMTDWWTLGCILYEMLLGVPPFAADNCQAARARVLAGEPLCFTEPNVLSVDARDLLCRLLCGPQQRLGVGGASEIKAHPFFLDIEWGRLTRRQYTPAFKPADGVPALKFPKKYQGPSIEEQFAGWGVHLEDLKSRMTPGPNIKEAECEAATDSTSSTELLSLAVHRHNFEMVKRLLADGVHPDFLDSIHPTAHHSRPGHVCWFVSSEERDKYVPPLIRAVAWRNLELARTLLLAGANANVGFHVYSDPTMLSAYSSAFSECCGRPVQLAMVLEHEEMVDLLLEFGADIDLAQPVLRDYQCAAFSRSSWIKMILRLSERRNCRLGTTSWIHMSEKQAEVDVT